MSDDNVIPFPTDRGGPRNTHSGSLPDPTELVVQLLAAGHTRQDLFAAISHRAAAGFDPPRPVPPRLLVRRKDVARYTIRVDLDGSVPPIWRRIEVPSDLGLDRLHTVVQAAMGWTNSHLHAFQMGPQGRDHRTQRFLTAYDLEEGDEGVAEADVRLDETLATVGDRLFYEYDFGDGWDHTLKLEKIDAPGEEEPIMVRLTGGRRACPPEDVGGIGSYLEVAAALAADTPPEDRWLRERLAWLPDGFDPADFDREAADRAVAAAAEGRWPLYELPFTHPELVEMMLALGPGGPLDDLVDTASAGSVGPLAEEIDDAVRPLTIMLDLVGEEGAELTGAGYLKPLLVERLAQATGITEWWIGKANREDLTPPVAALRSAAQDLGLLRKQRQRLRLTRVGQRVRHDPTAIWELLVNALPAGRRPYQRQAGLVALLVAAAGRPSFPFTEGADVLRQLGWSLGDEPITEYAAYDAARPTLNRLRVVDVARPRSMPTTVVMALARAALRPASPVLD